MNNNKPVLSGYTLEPAGPDTTTPNLDKRIPAGSYLAVWEYSAKFERDLPVLSNERVSKKRRILIHAGNYPKDTLGCILLGGAYDESGVKNSKATLEKFINLDKNSAFEVFITNTRGV